MPGQPVIVLDVAHNPHAAAALAQNIANMPCNGKTYAVTGMFQDKDIAGTVSKMTAHVDHWFCAGLAGPRGLGSDELAIIIQEALEAHHAGGIIQEAQQVHRAGSNATATAPHKPGVRPGRALHDPKRQVDIKRFENPVAAFNAARDRATVNDRILVFGSFATVGPVLEELGRKGP